MSDFKLPELPSDDELGITKEDLEKYGGDDEPEMSPEEMAALLGESPKPKSPPPSGTGKAPPTGATPPKGKAPPKGKSAPSGTTASPGQAGTAGGPAPKDPSKAPPPGKEPPKKEAAPRPQEPAGPRSRWRGPAMLAALMVLAWMTSSYRTLPSPEPANAPDSAFSSARAMAHLVEIARRPHPPGSPAHEQVRGYLLERMRDLGLEPRVQTTTSLLGRGTTVRATTVRNVIGRIPGRASTGTVVLTAHYDGREISRGAGDDASGVVAILEIVRALDHLPDLQNDVLVVITDAEELGLMGARAFVEQHPAMADVQAVISLEMRGSGGPSVMFETGPENGWIVRALRASGARPYANSMSYEIYKSLPNDTDFTPFREAGRQGLNFAAIGRASVYHQNYDSPENLSEATLQQHGASALAAVRYLGGTSLAEVSAPDVTFFTVPVLGWVIYDTTLALPIAAVLLIVALLVLLPVRKASKRWTGIIVGLVLALISVAATAGAGYGLVAWLPRFHPEFGSLHGSAFHHEGWYVSALVAVALAVVTALFGAARQRFFAAELTLGALILPLAAMAFVAIRFPAGAMNLQFPLAATLLGAGLLLIPAKGRTGGVLWVLFLALAVPVMAVLVPVVEFIWIGLSFRAAVPIGAVAAILVLLLLPALDRLGEPNRWWAPLTSLVLAGLFVAVGIRAAAPDPERPAPSTLSYLFDHGTQEALWITDDSDDPVDAPALAWAEAQAGVSFGETRSLERYGFGAREPRVAPATNTTPDGIRKPEVWTLADTTLDQLRHLRLGVRSAVGAELLQFRFAADGGTRLTAINGRPLPVEERPLLVEHWGAPDPVVILDLEMAAGADPEVDVVEHLFRPGELVGEEAFRRPPELAPDITWLSDRAVLRTPAAALEIIPGPPPFSMESEAERQALELAADAAAAEAAAASTDAEMAADTVGGEGLAPDTVTADTVAADTLAADTVPQPVDTVPPAAGAVPPVADTVPLGAGTRPVVVGALRPSASSRAHTR